MLPGTKKFFLYFDELIFSNFFCNHENGTFGFKMGWASFVYSASGHSGNNIWALNPQLAPILAKKINYGSVKKCENCKKLPILMIPDSYCVDLLPVRALFNSAIPQMPFWLSFEPPHQCPKFYTFSNAINFGRKFPSSSQMGILLKAYLGSFLAENFTLKTKHLKNWCAMAWAQ